MQTFERIYATQDPARGSRELYLLNMVFAIGCGVIVGEPVKSDSSGDAGADNKNRCEPEEYHASAIVHFFWPISLCFDLSPLASGMC